LRQSYCPYSKKAKRILDEYDVSPQAFVIELDQRRESDPSFASLSHADLGSLPLRNPADGALIQSLLSTLTGRHTVPNILLNYVPIGGSDDIELLYSEGSLADKLAEAGLALYSGTTGGVRGRVGRRGGMRR
jgi:glutaredoxin